MKKWRRPGPPCGSFVEPTVAACAKAKRVFAGFVTRYRWPTAFDLLDRSRDAVEVELTTLLGWDRRW
jgi:hypothetical protein